MARQRPRLSPRPAARGPARGVALVVALALATPARADPAADPTVLTAEGQARRDAGDVAGAIDRWQRALAALPVTQATAHRRGGLALALAAARVELFTRSRDVAALRAALEVLDGYLAGLDPTDDENRVAVEQRRAAIAALLAAQPGPRATSASAGGGDAAPIEPRRPPDRRLWIAGGALVGLGAVGVAALGLGLGLGVGAERALESAVARPGDDPDREAAKASALARGGRANDLALAGGVVGGTLLVTGVALLIAAAARGRPGRARVAPWGVGRMAGLAWRF